VQRAGAVEHGLRAGGAEPQGAEQVDDVPALCFARVHELRDARNRGLAAARFVQRVRQAQLLGRARVQESVVARAPFEPHRLRLAEQPRDARRAVLVDRKNRLAVRADQVLRVHRVRQVVPATRAREERSERVERVRTRGARAHPGRGALAVPPLAVAAAGSLGRS
jgi:hypothetical protein